MRILIIQTAFIGDNILSTGFIREVAKIFPKAKIDLLTTPVSAKLFKFNPYLTNIKTFRKNNIIQKTIDFIRLLGFILSQKYDIAFSLQIHFTSSLLMFLGGIPKRVGGDRMKLLTHPIKIPKNLHVIQRNAYILKKFSQQKVNPETELHFSSELLEEAIENTKTNKFKLGIAPGSVWNTKKWPHEYFIELMRMIEDDVEIYFIGSEVDLNICKDIIEKSGKHAHNLAGKLSLLQSAALIKQLDLMLTNDSAPMHMANAVKTDVVSFFGPTVKKFGCYPFRENDTLLEIDLDCRPCGTHGGKVCPKKHFRCMREITPQKVLESIKAYMEKK
jgi:heptosyltransferase-2